MIKHPVNLIISLISIFMTHHDKHDIHNFHHIRIILLDKTLHVGFSDIFNYINTNSCDGHASIIGFIAFTYTSCLIDAIHAT